MPVSSRPLASSLICAVVCLAQLPQILASDPAARELITRDGGEIDLGKSVPGKIDIVADEAINLLASSSGGIIAAASLAGKGEKKGRVVAFTHDSFLKGSGLNDQEPVFNLVANAIRWAGQSGTPSVGVHPDLAPLVDRLNRAGCNAEIIDPADFPAPGISVYCIVGQPGKATDSQFDRLSDYAASGGGLVVSATPWAFAKKFPDFSGFPGNRLLASSSIRFLANGTAGGGATPLAIGTPGRDSAPPEMSPNSPIGTSGTDGNLNSPASAAALELAEKHQSLANTERDVLMSRVETGTDLSGAKLDTFLDSLLKLNLAVGPIIPSKENPVIPAADPLVARIVRLENQLNQTLPAGKMYALPAAADYPGAVDDDAERFTHDITIDGKYRGWLSGRGAGFDGAKEMRPTGIYAAPGEVIRVTVPAKITGEGFEVVIGSYNGSVEKKDNWQRYLQLMRNAPINHRETEISNGLGGLVNIRIPREANYDAIDVTIEGGVRAPLYIDGVTDIDEWKRSIRKYPAPWTEIVGKRMIVTLPSDHIRNLNNPDEVVKVWDGIIECCAQLAGVDRDNYRAERVVFDRQISAGGMHSGYPFAAHIGKDSVQAVDARALKSDGNWGFFHELGHNHQHNLWALPGTGETTCNLWSVYVFEEFVGKNRDDGHRAISRLNRRQTMQNYFSGGAKFDTDWSVWTALETYLQIQESFGWEPFTEVFDEYNQLDRDQWPQTQQEKNDQFVIRLSRAVGKNLAPFWKIWALPLSEDVERELNDLPVWEDHPVATFAK